MTALSREAADDVGTVAKGGAVQILGQVTQRALLFAFGAVAVRVLGKADFGLFRLVAQILVIASQLGLAGFNYSAMRFIARARARGEPGGVRGAARVGLTGTAVFGGAVVLFLVIGADWVAGFFTDPRRNPSEVADLLRIGAAFVPLFGLMQVLRYATQAYRTMVPSVIVGNVVHPIARFVIGVGALIVGFAVAGVVVSLVVSGLVGVIAGIYYYRRMLTDDEKAAATHADIGPMVRFALPQGGSSLLGIQALGLGLIVLGALTGDAQVGLFAIALSLQGPGGVFLSGMVNIWAPVVSDLYERRDIARLGSLYQTITRWVATFSFPVFTALALEPDFFVTIFAGSRASDAAAVVTVLAIGNLFYSGTGPTGYVLSMSGRPGVNFVNSILAVALYAGLGALVVPDHGALGMAAVDAGVTAAINGARVVEARVLVGVQPFGKSFVKPVLATAVGAGALLAWRLLPGDGFFLELAGLAVAGAAYVAVLRVAGVDAEERYVWDRIKARIASLRRARAR